MAIINLEYMGLFNENAINTISKKEKDLLETDIGLYLTLLGILIN